MARVASRRRVSADEARAVLREQPLVGLVAAARLLGVRAPNVTRLRQQGRMPEGVPVEGSAMVYLRSEIEVLAGELDKERLARG